MTIRFWKSGSEGSVSSGDSSSQNSDISSAEDETVEVTRVKSIKITPGIGKFDCNFDNGQNCIKCLFLGCRESFIIKSLVTKPRTLEEIHNVGQLLIENRSSSSM